MEPSVTVSRTPAYQLRLLGAFELRSGGAVALVPSSAQRLLALLALESPIERRTAAGRLWPEVTDERAGSSLRTALSKVQHVCPTALRNGGGQISLGSSVWVDVRELRAAAGRTVAGQGGTVEAALHLLELRGELLPAWDEDWLFFEREELRQVRLQALESCAARLCGTGEFGAALLLAYEAIRSDPLRESALRLLIRIQIAQGNRVEAIRSYRGFAQQLWHEHQVRPSRMLEQLVRELREA